MTGHNHYADCMCGWCVGGWRNHGARSIPEPSRKPFWGVRWTYDSFTIPNAKCPVCNALVFYHEAYNGGRVFFDALGPPWPKHPCTDSGYQPRGSQPAAQAPIQTNAPVWKTDGWTPIAVERILREDDWNVLKCRRLEDDSFLRLLATDEVDGIVRSPAFLSPVSERGYALVSFLHPDGRPREVSVYDYGTHCLSTPTEVQLSRFGPVEPA